MICARRRLSASARAPASDGSAVTSAALTGTCLGSPAMAVAMVPRMTG